MEQNEQLIREGEDEGGNSGHDAIEKIEQNQAIDTEANRIPNDVELEKGLEISNHENGKSEAMSRMEACSTQNANNGCEACDAVKLLGRPSGVKRCVMCGKDWRMFRRREE